MLLGLPVLVSSYFVETPNSSLSVRLSWSEGKENSSTLREGEKEEEMGGGEEGRREGGEEERYGRDEVMEGASGRKEGGGRTAEPGCGRLHSSSCSSCFL